MVKGEQPEDDWPDDAAIGDGAETVSGIPGVGIFAVITRDEELALRDDHVYLAGGMLLWAVSGGNAPDSIVNKAIGIFVIINGHYAVFYYDALTWEGDSALDDVLVRLAGRNSASGGMLYSLCLICLDCIFVFVDKNDDLAAFGDIFLTYKVRPRDGGTVYDYAIIVVEGIFHTDADDIVTAIDVCIKKERA